MEQCELIEKLQALTMENKELKNINLELSEKIKESKNWAAIREGEILPRLQKTYGHLGPCGASMATDIGQIVKRLLNVSKFSQINGNNFDTAIEIALAITETVCKFEWPELKRLQESWGKYDKKHTY